MSILVDLRDRGAEQGSAKEPGWPTLVFTCLPLGAAAVGATYAGVAGVLDRWPPLGLFAAPLVSVALFWLAVHVIGSKKKRVIRAIGRDHDVKWEYEFAARPRIVAKAALLPLALASLGLALDVLPRPYQAEVDGYLCAADGTPLRAMNVTLEDAAGMTIASTSTDDDGFLDVDVPRWSFRAAVLRAQCAATNQIPSRRSIAAARGCRAAENATNLERHGEAVAWVSECPREAAPVKP